MQERLVERAAGAPTGAVAHVGGKASMPSGNFGPAPKVKDGSAEQEAVLRKAVTEARRMAAVGLGVLRAGASSERDRGLLTSHFHTTDPSLLATANQVLSKTLTGMNGELSLQVESTAKTIKGEATAYVYGGPFKAWSDIHLTPIFFGKGAQDQGATILHESTHKFADTVDHAYAGPGYDFLTTEQALENADSYAMFCQQHLGDRLAAEKDKQAEEADAAARSHGEEAWVAWEGGAIILGRDGFTTSAGVQLGVGHVKRIVLERFAERYPLRYQDVVRHLQTHAGVYTDVVPCSDGYAAAPELVRLIADEEML
jgi:hypothetical protein